MVATTRLPAELAAKATVGQWFTIEDARRVIDWAAERETRVRGIETADQLANGTFNLRLDPMLDLSGGDPQLSWMSARQFLETYANSGFLFEIVLD